MRRRSLWFVVPAHGRLEIANVCLRQLRRTCDVLEDNGVSASAVVIADDENLDIARAQGFGTIECDNAQLGRKINDGYQLACDPYWNPRSVDFAIPLGNDDWIDPHWIRFPRRGETVLTHLSSVVSEDCSRMAFLNIPFGDGVRVYHRKTLEAVGFRPADEDRKRAIDTSTHYGVRDSGVRAVWHDTHPLAIVDFKSHENLNDYAGCVRHYGRKSETTDVWGELARVYPAEAISEMQAVRGLVAA